MCLGFIIEVDDLFAKAILKQDELAVVADVKLYIYDKDKSNLQQGWYFQVQNKVYRLFVEYYTVFNFYVAPYAVVFISTVWGSKYWKCYFSAFERLDRLLPASLLVLPALPASSQVAQTLNPAWGLGGDWAKLGFKRVVGTGHVVANQLVRVLLGVVVTLCLAFILKVVFRLDLFLRREPSDVRRMLLQWLPINFLRHLLVRRHFLLVSCVVWTAPLNMLQH